MSTLLPACRLWDVIMSGNGSSVKAGMMSEVVLWSVTFVGGILLGLLFYGGLWWTVRLLPAVRRPALWMLSSFILRVMVTVGGFALLTAGDWRKVAFALFGFVVARVVIVRTLGNGGAIQS